MRSLRTSLFGGLLATLLAATATPVFSADSAYDGVTIIRGTVYSVGRADPRGQSGMQDLESGVFIDANYSSVMLNGGVGAKDFNGHRVVNAYAGFGFGRLIQIQAGYGDRGTLGRIRSDLNLRSVYNFFTQQRQAKRERTLADRITFTYTAERYSDEKNEEFDNGTIGVGVLFEGPF